MPRRFAWFFIILFALSLTGATVMNLFLVSQARQALDEGILAPPSPTVPYRYHVALVIPDTPDSFFDGLVSGLNAAAADSGVAVQQFRYRGLAPDEAETYFQLCLSSRLDGVILYTGQGDRGPARRAQAAEADVVFVSVGTQAPSSANNFIGSSSFLQGLESGNKAVERRGNSARIGLLLTSEGPSQAQEDPVYRGVAAALVAYPGAYIVRVSRARPGILSGEEAASALLKSEPSINVLVCASAPITEGAAQVVVDQGLVGRIALIGTDESPTIDRLVDKGVIAASIVRDSKRMGAEALRIFLAARAGTPERRPVEVGFTVRQRQESVP